MIYELRCYVPVPGRETDLQQRFADGTLALFSKLGIQVVDFWEHASGNGELWYLVAWNDEAAMRQAWDAFREDPDWLAMKQESEANGPLVKSITSVPLCRSAFFERSR